MKLDGQSCKAYLIEFPEFLFKLRAAFEPAMTLHYTHTWSMHTGTYTPLASVKWKPQYYKDVRMHWYHFFWLSMSTCISVLIDTDMDIDTDMYLFTKQLRHHGIVLFSSSYAGFCNMLLVVNSLCWIYIYDTVTLKLSL